MIYVDAHTSDTYLNFGCEYYFATEKRLDDTVFMLWQTTPTVMVGKYQNALEEINAEYVEKSGINVVRRMSGGGAIYTDLGGWQYTFITPNSDKTIEFDKYIGPIIDAIKTLGITAKFNGRNDLTIDDKKFSGTAQYIHNGYTVHHGSLLFCTDIEEMVRSTTPSDQKIISKGIQSVRDRVTNIKDHLSTDISSEEFKKLIVDYIMGHKANEYVLTNEDKERISALADKHFRGWKNAFGSSPAFSLERSRRFEGGTVRFRFDVKKGIITNCKIDGDFFGTGIELIEKALIGTSYNKADISASLDKIADEISIYRIDKNDLVSAAID